MQVTVEAIGGLERRMTVTLPRQVVNSAVASRLQSLTQTADVKGFRKGKVPLKVIQNRFGRDAREQVINDLVQRSCGEAMRRENLQPAGGLRCEVNAGLDDAAVDLRYAAVFEVLPDITLPDFSQLKVHRLVADIGEADVDGMIENLRRQRRSWEEVDQAAATGDLVTVDVTCRVDGETVPERSGANQRLLLGRPGALEALDKAIIGKRKGNRVEVPLTYPDDPALPALAGKEAVFEVAVKSVNAAVLPEVNDEFYASLGIKGGDEQGFRHEVALNMRRELDTASKVQFKRDIKDALVKLVDFPLPQALVENEENKLRALAGSNFRLSQDALGRLPEDVFTSSARRNVSMLLVVQELVRQENLSVDEKRVRTMVEELAATYEEPEGVIDWYYSKEDNLRAIRGQVLEDQVFDYIAERAQVTDKQVSYQELVSIAETGKFKPAPAGGDGVDEGAAEAGNRPGAAAAEG